MLQKMVPGYDAWPGAFVHLPWHLGMSYPARHGCKSSSWTALGHGNAAGRCPAGIIWPICGGSEQTSFARLPPGSEGKLAAGSEDVYVLGRWAVQSFGLVSPLSKPMRSAMAKLRIVTIQHSCGAVVPSRRALRVGCAKRVLRLDNQTAFLKHRTNSPSARTSRRFFPLMCDGCGSKAAPPTNSAISAAPLARAWCPDRIEYTHSCPSCVFGLGPGMGIGACRRLVCVETWGTLCTLGMVASRTHG